MQCELSAEARNAMVSLIYERWSEEYNLLKRVKEEKDDGSPDWSMFHTERLKRHKIEEARWKKILDEVKHYSPLLEQ